MTAPLVALAELVAPSGHRAGSRTALPVYSVTKHRGFVPSLEYFKKQVFSRELGGYTVVEPGELAYATIHLDEGSIGICPERCLVSPMYTAFKVDSVRVHAPFLERFLKSPAALTEYPSLGKGSAERRRSISLERLGTLRVPLPPLSEQRRIAAILDKADELRTKRRAALAQFDSLIQSVFLDMFGSPTTNQMGWQKTRIGDLGKLGTGSTPSRLDSQNFGGVIPWVKTTEVNWEAITETEEHLTAVGLRSSRCKVYPAGSLIVALYGQGKTRGQAAILGIDAATNQACGVLQANSSVVPEYLLEHSRLSYADLRGLSRGGNQENLNLSLLSDFRVMLPPVDRQRQFVTILRHLRKVKSRCSEQRTQQSALFASLQHRAFRGEL